MNSASSTATATKTLRIGVLAAIGTLDPRDSGDTITGLMLGQVFEMAYSMTEAGTLEPCLFAEFLRQERGGSQPVYSAAVRRLRRRRSPTRVHCVDALPFPRATGA
jgi:hypothetical protein